MSSEIDYALEQQCSAGNKHLALPDADGRSLHHEVKRKETWTHQSERPDLPLLHTVLAESAVTQRIVLKARSKP